MVDCLGRKIQSLGHRGNGPGEYGAVGAGSVAEDGTITVFAMGARKVTYNRDGKAVETLQMPIPQGPGGAIGISLAGKAVYMLIATTPSNDSIRNATVVRLSRNGRSYDSLFSTHASVAVNRSGAVPVTLFNTMPLMVADASGDVFLASPNTYAIERYSATGRVKRKAVVDLKGAPVTKASIASAIGKRRAPAHGGPSAEFDRMANESFEQQMAAAIASAPKALPVIDRLNVLRDGSIWVRRFALRDADSARWDRFNADGKPTGWMMTDGSTQIKDGDAARVLLLSKDSLDYPLLRWYSVSPSK